MRGRLHPVLQFGLRYGTATVQATGYVDSGASFSIFRSDVADSLGLDFKRGRLVHLTVGDGGEIPVYLHRLHVPIGQYEFPATIGFPEKLGVGFNLLGRKDVFTRLSFTFNDRYQFLLIQDSRHVSPDILSRLHTRAPRPSADRRTS